MLTIRRILEGVRAKNLEATPLFVNFSKAFDSISRGKMEKIFLANGFPKETVAAIMMRYKNDESKSSFTEWRHRLLRHCNKCATRRYISPIPVYYLPRLRASNTNRFKERKRLHAGRGMKQKIPRTNNYGHGLRRWYRASGKYTRPSRISVT